MPVSLSLRFKYPQVRVWEHAKTPKKPQTVWVQQILPPSCWGWKRIGLSKTIIVCRMHVDFLRCTDYKGWRYHSGRVQFTMGFRSVMSCWGKKNKPSKDLQSFLEKNPNVHVWKSDGFKATGRDVRRCADLGLAPSVCGRKTQMVIWISNGIPGTIWKPNSWRGFTWHPSNNSETRPFKIDRCSSTQDRCPMFFSRLGNFVGPMRQGTNGVKHGQD